MLLDSWRLGFADERSDDWVWVDAEREIGIFCRWHQYWYYLYEGLGFLIMEVGELGWRGWMGVG
jgi:hypothetical protein